MTIVVLSTLGGVALGYLLDQWWQNRFWRRLALQVFTIAPMSTEPPTLIDYSRFPAIVASEPLHQ